MVEVVYSIAVSFGQHPGWQNFNNGDYINVLADDGDHIWSGSRYGGLARINKSSDETEFYNKSNSGLPDP